MKKVIFFIFCTIFSHHCHAQISFEKGYYIDPSGQKIEGLIKNMDWRNNPAEFEYRRSENDDVQTINTKTIEEFGVYNTLKYIKKKVKIDISSDNLNKLDNKRNAIFDEREILLKVLIEGESNLYEYVEGNIRRYFYKTGISEIAQLIYKRYNNKDNSIGYNTRFRQQLWNDLKCSNPNPNLYKNELQNTEYTRKDLVKFFIEHNKCVNSEMKTYGSSSKADKFNLSLRPGLNISSLSILNNNDGNSLNTDFGTQIGFRFGLESEFILPFNKNKWAILAEPTYQYFKSENSTDVDNVVGGKLVTNIDYKSIELPVGIRHYFFLPNESKIFLDLSYVIDLELASPIVEINRLDGSNLRTLDVDTSDNLAIGMGYKFGAKYSIQIRYHTSRDLLRRYIQLDSNYNTFSFIIGYSIF